MKAKHTKTSVSPHPIGLREHAVILAEDLLMYTVVLKKLFSVVKEDTIET